jgi:hypothetical protein
MKTVAATTVAAAAPMAVLADGVPMRVCRGPPSQPWSCLARPQDTAIVDNGLSAA